MLAGKEVGRERGLPYPRRRTAVGRPHHPIRDSSLLTGESCSEGRHPAGLRRKDPPAVRFQEGRVQDGRVQEFSGPVDELI